MANVLYQHLVGSVIVGRTFVWATRVALLGKSVASTVVSTSVSGRTREATVVSVPPYPIHFGLAAVVVDRAEVAHVRLPVVSAVVFRLVKLIVTAQRDKNVVLTVAARNANR